MEFTFGQYAVLSKCLRITEYVVLVHVFGFHFHRGL